ncbi:ribosomal protein S17P [Trichinella nativa]|uniref:Small ribosomal subunit protein uS17 n=1 Tax=Trichinella nativa TaxID=6335 RepID=A0A1Y3EDT3_9BILA|nr:ribosomal protein S17P [Trichinella nativa]
MSTTIDQAKEGNYIDKKCPFTGNVSIRGRILTGVVMKMKMQRTIVIRRDYLHYVKKYARFEKRHKNMSVHLSPCFRDVKVGDIVTVGECRPLSKTVRFNVIKVTKAPGSKKAFEKTALYKELRCFSYWQRSPCWRGAVQLDEVLLRVSLLTPNELFIKKFLQSYGTWFSNTVLLFSTHNIYSKYFIRGCRQNTDVSLNKLGSGKIIE